MQRRDRAFDGLERASAIGPERGHSIQQAAGVGMRRGVEDVVLGAQFHQAAGVHDGHAIGDLRDIALYVWPVAVRASLPYQDGRVDLFDVSGLCVQAD